MNGSLLEHGDVKVFESALPPALFDRLLQGMIAIGDDLMAPEYNTVVPHTPGAPKGSAKVSKVTFFYPFSRSAKNVVEEAIDHLRTLVKPPESCCGVEYWLGRTEAGCPIAMHEHRDS